MNPREAYLSVLKGEKPDILPTYVANISDFLQFYYDISAKDFVQNPDLHVDVTIRAIDEFRFGCVAPAAYIFFGCGPEIGVNWKFAGDALPSSVGSMIETRSDLEKFKIPSKPSGYFENYLQILTKLKKRIGNKVYIMSYGLGPFAIACFVRGVEEALLDPLDDLEFYQSYMPKCVELSKFVGRNILDIGLQGSVLNEIFLSPYMISASYFHKYILPYDDEISEYFKQGNQQLPNSFAAFMGKPDDPESQKVGKIIFNSLFGTKESLDIIKEGMGYPIPGYPTDYITLSGRMMAYWNKNDITDFLRNGLNFLVKEKKRYPAIRMTSLNPPNKKEAFKMAEKIKAVNNLIDSYEL